MASSSSERTEPPSPRRLREARRRGQVAVSRDLASALGFACALAALIASLPSMRRTLASSVGAAIDRAEHVGALTPLAASTAINEAIWAVLQLSLPVGIAAMTGGVLLTLLQTRGLVTAASFALKAERLNPLSGIKRLVAHRTLVELGKTWVKLFSIAAAALWAVTGEGLRGLVHSAWTDPGDALVIGARVSLNAACAVAAASIAIGGVDVLLQRWLHARDLRMTKDEARRDHKEDEGDPQVKQARKQLHRELALSTMLRATRTASFVAVNPTHLAVAVTWNEDQDDAPRIVAKGAGEIARRIRREGERSGVRIVRDKPLARALFALPVETEIPEALYLAVAETLAFIAETTSGATATASAATKAPPATSLSSREIPEADGPA